MNKFVKSSPFNRGDFVRKQNKIKNKTTNKFMNLKTMNKTKMMRKILALSMLIFSMLPFLTYGQGSTYTGSYTSSSRIEYSGKTNLVIEGKVFNNTPGHSITLWNSSDIIIRNCKFTASPQYLGIYLYGCKNITITNCTFENLASAMLASTCTGNIKFDNNDVKNILGTSQGGDIAGSMVQFVRVTGAGNSVSYNACENIPGESAPEDLINMNDGSAGTPESPIIISNNWIRGGGPSPSGGGINLGDVDGSYQTAENNILVDPGQYGIGISGGHHLILRNNKVYAKQQSFTNVGITACNWYTDIAASHDITISNNEINYKNSSGQLNNWWFASNVGTIVGQATNVYNANLSASILPAQILGRAVLNTNPTYVWNQTSAASFTTATNWTPSRTSPTAKDVLQFSAGGSVVVTNLPDQLVEQLLVSNNTKVTFQTSSSSKLAVNSLTIDAGATLVVGAGNKLTVNTTLTNNGALNLLSDNTNGSASILTPSALAGTGTYNIQQYLSVGNNANISSPVTLSTASVLSSATSVTTYNETTAQWDNTTGSLIPAKGYLANSIKTNGVVTFSGVLNNGSQSIPLTRTTGKTNEGFNLVGNPYASYLNLNNLTNGNIESTIWFRSKDVGQLFDVYNLKSGVSTSNSGLPVTGYVPPMQAFWVRVKKGKSPATLSLNNAMRSHIDVSNNIFRAPASYKDALSLLRLKVSAGTVTDETVIYGDLNALDGLDDYDSSKGMNGATSTVPDIYTTVDAENLAINGLSIIPLDTEIPLTFAANKSTSTTFTIVAKEVNNLSGISIILKDNATGTETDITNGTNAYSFSASNGTTKSLSVIFRSSSVTTGTTTGTNNNIVDEQATTIYKNNRNQISVNCNGGVAPQASVSVSNAEGQKVITKNLTGYHTVLETIKSGVYDVTVINGEKTKTQQLTIN